MGVRRETGVEPEPEPQLAVGVTGQQRVELREGLDVDQAAGIAGRDVVGIGLADTVHDDALAGESRPEGQRQLDRVDDLRSGPLGGEPTKEPRVGVGLDGVGDQRTGKGRPVLGQVGGRGVEVGEIERRAPSVGGGPQLVRGERIVRHVSAS